MIAVVGPTACGKTRRAVALARALDGEIISADSRQVYRDMTIGTGKDLEDYGEIPYHIIDICDAGEKYNLHRYLADFERAESDIRSRGKEVIICGGSGLYVESALAGIKLPEVPADPALRQSLAHKSLAELTEILASMKRLHNTTDVDTAQRAIRAIEIETWYQQHPEQDELRRRNIATRRDALIIGVDVEVELRRQRISQRLRDRLDSGMVDEVKKLLDSGISAEDLIYYGLEYKFVTLYLTGALTEDEMFRLLEIAIHQFAKRQMTWFRGMERRGFKIHWLHHSLSDDEFVAEVRKLLATRDGGYDAPHAPHGA